MTIINFSLLFYLSLFLYDDIGRGQLNMQLNKSDEGEDEGGERRKEEVEEEEEVTSLLAGVLWSQKSKRAENSRT